MGSLLSPCGSLHSPETRRRASVFPREQAGFFVTRTPRSCDGRTTTQHSLMVRCCLYPPRPRPLIVSLVRRGNDRLREQAHQPDVALRRATQAGRPSVPRGEGLGARPGCVVHHATGAERGFPPGGGHLAILPVTVLPRDPHDDAPSP